ncbi:response regulator [Paracoccus sp. Z118]|uniref:ATP-binding response regulator n=1 Tax=Paracoccus sp. Z118 TaxID=2851017 RepID=UPI001C2C1F2C|nr:HAMP domain-containing sensor histidine kinase [Paracoccus sp. Z118]MBV0892104.1 response regulator [Paracoccus sp. Z118]
MTSATDLHVPPAEPPERRIQKLERINAALMQRIERVEEARGPAWALTRATAVLEREVLARNRDLERTMQELAASNAELASAREVADQANRAKSRFLRAASHDLLQPLSAAKLFLSHLAELSQDTHQRDLVSHLIATIDSADELIQALSNIARLDSQNFQMHMAPVAMGRLFRRLLIDLQPLANARGIDLRFVPTRAAVESDPVYLRQIVQNLIANALKYTSGSRVLVGLRHRGDRVWLEVLDQGPGIAKSDQDRIFNEFERLSRAKQPGTGLGLSIVRRACEQLGHPLELLSDHGTGSVFRVGLKRVSSEEIALRPQGAADGRLPDDLHGLRILVVENDPAMRRAYAMLLGGWGMEVRAIGDIATALAAARAEPPDLVLTDYRLDNGETGIAALEALIAERGKRIAALIISAETVGAIRHEARGLDVEVLEKPVAEDELRRALRAALIRCQ